MNKKILAVVCARWGSKRFPGKNYRLFCDVPLFLRTIIQAISYKAFTHTVFSTDSYTMKTDADKYQSQKFYSFIRDKKLATDKASKIDTIRDACLKAEDHFGVKYDLIMDLDVTYPLRATKDIKAALAVYNEHPLIRKPVRIVAVCERDYMLIWLNDALRHVCLEQLTGVVNLWNRVGLMYPDDSQFDWLTTYKVPDYRAIDINYEWQFKVAEFMAKNNLDSGE